MSVGGGKYQNEVSEIIASTGAVAAFVIVVGGVRGSGFSVALQLDEKGIDTVAHIPSMLRQVATQIERDMIGGGV